MSFINFDKREINFKIVYYGPPLCGKTTNLSHLHEVMPASAKGDLTMLSTQQDRTLYFDFLPLQSSVIKSFVSRFQLYTVPGQPIYDRTRQIVLTGADNAFPGAPLLVRAEVKEEQPTAEAGEVQQ